MKSGSFATRALAAASLAALLAACATTPEPVAVAEPDMRSSEQFFAAAPDADWQEIAPEDLLVMEWPSEEGAEPNRVVIRLADIGFGTAWTTNVRAIARQGYWADAGIYRVIPPFVAQWGIIPPSEPGTEEPDEPDFLLEPAPGSFIAPLAASASPDQCERTPSGPAGICDAFAPEVRLVDGWVMGSDGASMWPIFCRSTVGVARGMDNQGSGSALYAVLQTERRNMDRNIGFVGKVIEGMDLLEDLPAATGPGGVYSDPAQVPMLTRYTLVSDMPEAERPRYRMLRTGTASHDAWLARLVQPNPFYSVRYAAADVCENVVPVVPIEAE
ncbi:peptidylprolyl isomerase [Aurantiacibacter sp. MUD61]|uniref:peptidylprolyl isomerase n=1 Tax=Aurantiacibacter sp. MUD61 TaxID=3009083 RepID=UPI0022EFFA14|nr:peptidylprolyl isomerase [Aurantiacibacter sp. MUD61]